LVAGGAYKNVNAGEISGDDMDRIGTGLHSIDGRKATADHKRVFEMPHRFINHWRQLLAAVVNDPSIIDVYVCTALALALDGKIVAVPVPGLTPDGFVMNYRIAATSVFSALDHANVLFLSTFLGDLCQCHLPSCGSFFLSRLRLGDSAPNTVAISTEMISSARPGRSVLQHRAPGKLLRGGGRLRPNTPI
jgi:hypothetical protein